MTHQEVEEAEAFVLDELLRAVDEVRRAKSAAPARPRVYWRALDRAAQLSLVLSSLRGVRK